MGRRRIIGAAGTAFVVGSLGFLAAGCGSTSHAAATTASTSATTTTTGGNRSAFSADFQKFQSCLKNHGVTIPTFRARPGGQQRTFTGPKPANPGSGPIRIGGGGFAQRAVNLTPKQRSALAACQKLLPNGGKGQTFRARGAGGAGFAKYTACLKQHGVTFGGANQNQTKFAKAQAACRSLLPKPNVPPAATTTPSS
ncbi:MAG TPA: hypothetical protein VFW85_07275 [Gaiellaceae bacterium]|nr:hypothetical protein [Gaiellaceae bacterium]